AVRLKKSFLMKNIRSSNTAIRRTKSLLLSILLVMLGSIPGSLFAEDQARKKIQPASSKAAETATQFLGHLDKAEINAAIGLWDSKFIGDKLQARIDKMSSKVRRLGGIKKVDIGQCEKRRNEKFEQTNGEKIDVIPMEIICGDENLILAVFSVRKQG